MVRFQISTVMEIDHEIVRCYDAVHLILYQKFFISKLKSYGCYVVKWLD